MTDTDLSPLTDCYGAGARAEREKICNWLLQNGASFRPVSEARVIECEHGCFGWEACEECTIIQCVEAIRNGEHLV